MTINIKNYVIQELEAYPRILRQISVLRYEMEHPAHVSAQEMLDAMAYACGDRTGSSPGHVSDKTFYIAMNYRQKAAAANSEISEEISAKLLELERKKGRIEYYVGMLDSRKANVIRLCFFEGRTIEDAAEELNISAKTAQIAKKKAIEELTDLFALTSNINCKNCCESLSCSSSCADISYNQNCICKKWGTDSLLLAVCAPLFCLSENGRAEWVCHGA